MRRKTHAQRRHMDFGPDGRSPLMYNFSGLPVVLSSTLDADNSTYPEPYPLIWDDTADEYFRRRIDYKIQTSRKSGPFKPFSTDVFEICRGFSFVHMCKTHGATPGSVFQAGMQLALGMFAGRPMSVNEVVSIR